MVRSVSPLTTRSTDTRPHPGARHRFALAGGALALLALVAGLGTPVLARMLATLWTLPGEVTLVAVGFAVASGFLLAGWALGRRVDALAEEARRDPITRVGNRRHWEESLTIEVRRAAEAKMPLSLLMVDVDNLKKLNDGAGHGAGDRALAIVGDVLIDTSRSRDVTARFGGDEFALLLPRTRASEATVVAERIRAELSDRCAAEGPPFDGTLTVSIGIADIDAVGEYRARALFEAADRALYAAKQAGRDRVEVAAPPPVPRVIVLDEHRRARKRRTHA